MTAVDGAVRLSFALTLASLVLVVIDLARSPSIAIVMKWGWTLVVAYTGPIGLVIYLLSCREPLPGMHGKYVAPLWKQAVGSTIHCVAGDATGIIAGALLGTALAMPARVEAVFEYVAGFGFGLFIFQALLLKLAMGGGYVTAVRRSVLPEWLSMNALMGGMLPVMSILMHRDPVAMRPANLLFWGVMSGAVLVGAVAAYPVNVWLVARGLKHGMGSARILGRGGRDEATTHQSHQVPSRLSKAAVLAGSVIVLAVGVSLAARFGDV
jgi:hypothetical protein